MTPQDWVTKDFYKALGVKKDASAADIKKSYRKLARDLHPDKNPDDKKAEERFKEVSEAYSVVGDEDKRKEYDEARSLFANGGGFRFPGSGGGGGGGNFSDMFGGGDLGDLFGGLFNRGGGGGGAGSGGPGPGARRGRRGADIESEVSLSFDDALNGARDPDHTQGCESAEMHGGLMDRYVTGTTCLRAVATPADDLLTLPRKPVSQGNGPLGVLWKLLAKNTARHPPIRRA